MHECITANSLVSSDVKPETTVEALVSQPEIFENLSQDSNIPQVFVGYDDRESDAFDLCRSSILRYASGPVDIYTLEHRDLRSKKLFTRNWEVDPETGKYRDANDGLFFSTTFSHTRFLTPLYAKYLGIHEPLALFVDTDFVFFDDIYKLFRAFNMRYKVGVVKHKYQPPGIQKMDDQTQYKHVRKLWSSLMMFNLRSGIERSLTKDYVNSVNTKDLHLLKWVDDKDIFGLPEKWNFIPNHSEQRCPTFSAIHFTEGIPTMQNYETCKYSRHFLDMLRRRNFDQNVYR